MMVSTQGSFFRLLLWQWKGVTIFSLGGIVAALIWQFVPALHWLKLPGAPLAVAGAAIGIFCSFRTNSAYDRWWEGRKLWGRMINVSRMFCSQVLHYLPADRVELRARLVHRHSAYVHALRCLLRQEDPFADDDFMRRLPDDPEPFVGQSNLTHALLHRQVEELTALDNEGALSEFRLQSLDRSIEEMLAVQGGCERIKKTPMPRVYGFIASRLIYIYAFMFPLGVVFEIGWLVIPINVLVCLAFALISEAGRVLEDPFTLFFNGLPLYAMSMMIERNLGERVGDTDLVDVPGVDERGLLM